MLSTFLTAVLLGFSAGLSPGPLLTLVVVQTARFGRGEGIRVAMAPLLTDLPIIVLSFLLLAQLGDSDTLMGMVGIVGSGFVFHLGVETWRAGPVTVPDAADSPRSWRKGVLVNFLNPHPYLFWMTVGGPIVIKGAEHNPLIPWIFLFGFYSLLIGGKVLVAVLISHARRRFLAPFHGAVMKGLGILLMLLALILVRDALRLSGA